MVKASHRTIFTDLGEMSFIRNITLDFHFFKWYIFGHLNVEHSVYLSTYLFAAVTIDDRWPVLHPSWQHLSMLFYLVLFVWPWYNSVHIFSPCPLCMLAIWIWCCCCSSQPWLCETFFFYLPWLSNLFYLFALIFKTGYFIFPDFPLYLWHQFFKTHRCESKPS